MGKDSWLSKWYASNNSNIRDDRLFYIGISRISHCARAVGGEKLKPAARVRERAAKGPRRSINRRVLRSRPETWMHGGLARARAVRGAAMLS